MRGCESMYRSNNTSFKWIRLNQIKLQFSFPGNHFYFAAPKQQLSCTATGQFGFWSLNVVDHTLSERLWLLKLISTFPFSIYILETKKSFQPGTSATSSEVSHDHKTLDLEPKNISLQK